MLAVTELLREALARTTDADAAPRRLARAKRGRSGPALVELALTQHCNVGCDHCYAAPSGRSSPSELTTSELLRVLDELSESGVRTLRLSGGEPLLRSDVVPLVEEASTLGMEVQLLTNGLLLDDVLATRLARAGLTYVGVNVDGARASNGGEDEGAALERTCEVLRVVGRAGMQAGLHVRLTDAHTASLEARYRLARDGGATRFHASHLVYVGTARRHADTQPPRAARRATSEALFALAERHLSDVRAPAIVTEGNESDGPLLLRYVDAHHGAEAARVIERRLLQAGGNLAGEDALAIDPRGRVHPSPYWQHALLGDLRKQPFGEALAHPLRDELQRRAARLEGRCGGCRYLALCRGGHRERALVTHGSLWAPDPDCLLEEEELVASPEDALRSDARA